jgi:hypothetical protein
MRSRTKGLAALVVVGVGVGLGAAVLRRRLHGHLDAFVADPQGSLLTTTDQAAALAELNSIVGKLVPGFSGFPSIEFDSEEPDEPHTVGEIRAEHDFVSLIEAAGWPITAKDALDAEDDFFVVCISTENGQVKLAEYNEGEGFRIVSYTGEAGVEHTAFPEDFTVVDTEYENFLAQVAHYGLDKSEVSTT